MGRLYQSCCRYVENVRNFAHCFVGYLQETVRAEDGQAEAPPIRSLEDPRDIYLA